MGRPGLGANPSLVSVLGVLSKTLSLSEPVLSSLKWERARLPI